MNIQVQQKPIGAVLFQYDIYPEKIETVGKVKKVFSANGVYALKEAKMNQEEADWFVHVIRRLERIGFHYVVPILPTKYGDYIVRYNEQAYYMMPWYEDNTEFRHPVHPEEVMVEELARLHGLTERTQEYSEEVLEESYETLKRRWGYRRLEMERYADQIEGNVYLSPFELTFLTHFQRSLYMADEAEKHLSSWIEGAKHKKSFRSVLCHGKPSRKHACFDKYGTAYLLNFEKAVLDTPSRDLALLFRHFFQSRPWDEQEGQHWLHLYERHFALFEEEKHLFISYLAFPESIYQAVDAYKKKDNAMTELQAVTQLERKILTMNRVQRFMTSLFEKKENE
ncbi:spore coat protein YsxE [Evansella cellulosilytica]|uniref:Spore coat protein YsxE n=1 Tax=Evansella cellulosilytica (strain ATCC 21833 / DSM 2522 / FERM P-1141 / JCM 9156 / N-4) TaxID=649639 RepID=E6TZQ7_EVAC2|nr:spore coat protein YsxE [Evansella cellulosilytica]ADU31363.1 spore coat protein YsxE [Evansella cellulosilytica DSM 2522]